MELLVKGQKAALYFTKGDNLVEMICDIEEVLADRLILVPPPYFMRFIEFLQEGLDVLVKVFTKMGTIDYNAIIISSPLEDVFSIELDYNTLNLTIGKDMPVINALEKLEIKESIGSYAVSTFEISTEYLKFSSSNKSFQVGDVIECKMCLPEDYGIITFKGNISEVDPIYDNEYTVVYETMTEKDRQTLLYYMYMYSSSCDD